MDVILGLDIGTTNTKACLFAITGGMVGNATVRTPVDHLAGFGECHTADALWGAVCQVIRESIAQVACAHGHVHVVAMAVTSFAEEGVCLDAELAPVAPIIPWYDARTDAQVHAVKARIAPEPLRRLTGMPLDRSFSLCKLLWMKEHMPHALDRAVLFLPVADYIQFRLTGQIAGSPSLASRTLLYHPFEKQWLTDLLSLFDMADLTLPPIVPGGTAVGRLTKQACIETGLSSDTQVAVGGHDDACAALAAGVVHPGTGVLSSGTAESIYVIASEANVDTTSASLCVGRDATGDSLYVSDFIPTGALLRWAMEHIQIAPGSDQRSIYTAIAEGAKRLLWGDAAPGACVAQFEFVRSPISLTSFSWSQLHLATTGEELLTAVLQSTAAGLQAVLQEIRHASGAALPTLTACGGLSAIPEYVAWKEQQLDCKLVVQGHTELTAGGAAVLAAYGTGHYESLKEARHILERAEVRH